MPKFKPRPRVASEEIQTLKEEKEYLEKRFAIVPEQDHGVLIKWIGEIESEILRKTELLGDKKLAGTPQFL